MSKNEIYRDGHSISYSFGTANPSIVSGQFVFITANLRGVAETDSALRSDGNYWATIRHIGVFSGTTADAVTVGQALYLAGGVTKGTALTTVATANNLVGYAAQAKGAGAGNVAVRINN